MDLKHGIFNDIIVYMSGTKWIVLNIILFILVILLAFAESLVPLTVKVVYASIDGDKTVAYHVRERNVADFVKDEKVVSENDILLTDENKDIKNGMTVKVNRPNSVTCNINGEKKDLLIYPVSTEENLKLNDISYDEDDIVKPALDKKITSNEKITVKDVEVKTVEKKIAVKAKTKMVFDKNLTSGTVTTVDGQDGKGLYRITTKYVNGKKVSREKKLVKWIKKPVDNTTSFGTSVTGETGEVKYSRTLTSNTTAYFFKRARVVGASGQPCHYGTCAVDTSVFPFGTRLYVEGYGIAVANDRGSAIKGTKLDLYMRDYNEALRWGRRFVKVYVLDDQS